MRVGFVETATGVPAPFVVTLQPDTGRIASLGDADGTLTYREVPDPPPLPATTPVCPAPGPRDG